ncbi:MAG: undecaprenyl-diphosphate phosphatase [Pseudomonadota bacterium]|nr:undecaprenyl-diphosphate phosphatase [Pseudomonadota bacterium]
MENNIQILNILILAIIQGATEFFPVSSSAHLILFSKISGQTDQGLVIDTFLHLGSFFAVLAYFYNDIRLMLPQFRHSANPADSKGLALLLQPLFVLTHIAIYTFLFNSLSISFLASVPIFFIRDPLLPRTIGF